MDFTVFALTPRSLKEMKEPPGDIWQWMQLPGWLDDKEPVCQLRSRKRLRFVCVCVCVCVKLLQSCPTLCNPVVNSTNRGWHSALVHFIEKIFIYKWTYAFKVF